MKKYLITYSLSVFYAISLIAQTATKDTFLFSSTPWETTDIGNGITWQHYHFKDKQLFNANENIHILRLKNKSKKAQLAFASAGIAFYSPANSLDKVMLWLPSTVLFSMLKKVAQ